MDIDKNDIEQYACSKTEVTIMTEKERRDFCTECRKETEYMLQKKDIKKTIRDKEYTFGITVAVCAECGEEMSIPGLIDKNIREIDEQYRAIEGLVSIDDIEKLMKIYKIGKAPLSLALGFGEITIPRYLEGQFPSKEYSDIIKAALSSPVYTSVPVTALPQPFGKFPSSVPTRFPSTKTSYLPDVPFTVR